MATTVIASWLVGSNKPPKRNIGFWLFLASNALWIAWALHANAPALIVLQVALAAMNVRGVFKTEEAEKKN
ncbi:MAG: hypothetical protein H7255_00455 [Ramlibacter sp.]|nr:hypothetical protein [Ramlibacter sp.]